MKKFFFGFILAALLFSAMPIGAAVEQYILTPSAAKIVVDGAEVKDNKLPIMNYQGYNYIPAATFRSICDKIGVEFEWDNTTKEIQLSTKEVKAVSETVVPAAELTPTTTTTPAAQNANTEQDTKPPEVTFEGGTWPPKGN